MTAEESSPGRSGAPDLRSVERLVAHHRPAAFRIALGVLGDADAAEDVAQDVSVRLAAAAPGFDEPSELSAWVYRVTLNLCRDHLRRDRRRAKTIPIESAGLTAEEQPERAIDLARARSAIATALDRLTEDQREVLVLRYVAGLPYAEIALSTSTAQGTVASRVFRALKRLGEELDPRHLEVLK